MITINISLDDFQKTRKDNLGKNKDTGKLYTWTDIIIAGLCTIESMTNPKTKGEV